MNKFKTVSHKKCNTDSLEYPIELSWRKIAQKRLDKLNNLKRQCARLRDDLAIELARELSIQLHAHYFPRNAYKSRLKAIAESVAERVRLKLYER